LIVGPEFAININRQQNTGKGANSVHINFCDTMALSHAMSEQLRA